MKMNRYRTLSIACILMSVYILFRPYTELSSVNYFSVLPLFLSVILSLKYQFHNYFNLSKLYIPSSIMTIVFIMMLSLDELIRSDLFTKGTVIFKLLYLLIVLFATFYCFMCLFDFCLSCKSYNSITSDNSNGLVVLLECVGSIVALSTICIISSVPGIWLQADVEAVHNSVINSMWDEWHTMGYLLFVKFCYLFKDGVLSLK